MVALSIASVLLLEAKPSSSSISSSGSSSSSSSFLPPLRWNPLAVHRGLFRRAGRRLHPLGRHSSRLTCSQLALRLPPPPPPSTFSSSSDDEKKINKALGCGFVDSVLEALGAAKKPAAASAAVLLGLLIGLGNPCDASLAASYPWKDPWICSAPCSSTTFLPQRYTCSGFYAGADYFTGGSNGDGYLVPLSIAASAAALKLFSLFLSIATRNGSDQKAEVCSMGITCSLPKDLSWVGEISGLLNLDESSDLITYTVSLQTNLKGELNSPGSPFQRARRYLTKAVATIEPRCSTLSDSRDESDDKLQLVSSSESLMIHHLDDESLEIDDREKLRRTRISKANKGNVPWNKGRKHSAETIQRIREKTRLAMQDPKVKMKLMNLGHAQSEETRLKISAGVREGWQRRREKLMVQEHCFFEWKNSVAEVARKGFAGEDQLQWSSYQILDDKLKLEWLESIEKRKAMGRPKGSKRAPKSADQRRKISEAISAKWADPGYRDRVCSALAKYHGTPVATEKREKRKPTGETPLKKDLVRKKPTKLNSFIHEVQNIKKVISKRKKNSTPLYKDPMASSKLEMIKKIREQRAVVEAKTREAAERAKLLIAEAEKAAKALEMAALKSPLAQASLLEARMLIAEATRSIEKIETGQLASHDTGESASLDFSGPLNHFGCSPATVSSDKLFNEPPINGIGHLSSSNHKDFDKLTLKAALNGRETPTATGCTEHSAEVISGFTSPFYVEKIGDQSEAAENHVSQNLDTGVMICENFKSHNEELDTSGGKNSKSLLTSSIKMKKKWLCGRLIEIEDQESEKGEQIGLQ